MLRLSLTFSRLFGFLTGAVVAGASVYYYVLGDYRVSNEMLNDDITVRSKSLFIDQYSVCRG